MSVTIDLHTAGTDRRRSEAEARREDRMAELVSELTGCAPAMARHALRENDPWAHRDPLGRVAHAMIAVAQPSPLREPIYLDGLSQHLVGLAG